jgi:hypothetical protein
LSKTSVNGVNQLLGRAWTFGSAANLDQPMYLLLGHSRFHSTHVPLQPIEYRGLRSELGWRVASIHELPIRGLLGNSVAGFLFAAYLVANRRFRRHCVFAELRTPFGAPPPKPLQHQQRALLLADRRWASAPALMGIHPTGKVTPEEQGRRAH